MPHHSSTFLSLNLESLLYNYRFFTSKLSSHTAILAVVKAFAYGHAAVPVAQCLEKEGVAYLGVAFTDEGIALRKAGIKTPILVLHPQQADISFCSRYNLEPNVYSFQILKALQNALKESDITKYPIHLKFNTGLNRLGFLAKDIPKLISKLKTAEELKVRSVFSHLAASEDVKERDFTLGQIQKYHHITEALKKALPYSFTKHLCNTSGTLNYPEAHFDMVRIGIGLYGYANDEKWTSQLKNVGCLQSVISQIYSLEKGDSVGYNRAFTSLKKMRSATIPIGYADGIPRTWSNGVGFVTIHGKKAPVLGNVCMDMLMVDVSDISCAEGDKVFIFDSQLKVEELATRTHTISYELLTAISQRVPRIVIKE